MIESKSKVLIYAGPGTGKDSVIQTKATLKNFLSENYTIETILFSDLMETEWESKTALFVIPGGADIPYAHTLNGKGNGKIKSFIENGGAFLGICAGAYYGSSKVEFAVGSPLEVIGDRELAFFPGKAYGPCLAPYNYKNHSGARVTRLKLSTMSISPVVFYAGGCSFVDASCYPNVEVVAAYDHDETTSPAIVKCKVGKGLALLSGVHFEFAPLLMDSEDIYLKHLIPELQKGENERVILVKSLLGQLGLEIFKQD